MSAYTALTIRCIEYAQWLDTEIGIFERMVEQPTTNEQTKANGEATLAALQRARGEFQAKLALPEGGL